MRKNSTIKFILAFLVILCFSISGQAKLLTVGAGISSGSPVHPTLFREFYKQGVGYNLELKCNLFSCTSIVLGCTYQTIQSDLKAIEEEIEERLDPPAYVKTVHNSGFVNGLVSLNILQYLQQKGKMYRFYITAGGGYGFRRVHETKLSLFLGYADEFKFNPEDGYQLGLNGGLGFEIGLYTNGCLYIQALYHYLFIDEIALWNPETGTIESIHEGASFVTPSIGLRIDL